MRFLMKGLCLWVSFFYPLAWAGMRFGDPVAGKKKSETCAGCHAVAGYKSSFPVVYSVPKLVGQNFEYIVSALNDYASGERRNPVMRANASVLSEQDILDLAAYYSKKE